MSSRKSNPDNKSIHQGRERIISKVKTGVLEMVVKPVEENTAIHVYDSSKHSVIERFVDKIRTKKASGVVAVGAESISICKFDPSRFL